MTNIRSRWFRSAGLAVLALAAATAAAAQGSPEVFKAMASFKTAAGVSVSAPVTVTISKWTADADRDRALAALRSGGSTAFHTAVAAMPEVGSVQVGAVKTPLRYARMLPVGSGNVVTVATSAPMYHIGAGAIEAKPKAGYDMAVAIFEVDAQGKGTFGDFSPAAKVKVDEKGAIVIEDYGTTGTVQLSDIAKK